MIETLCNVCGFKMKHRRKKKKLRHLCMSCEINPPKKESKKSNVVTRNFYLSQQWRSLRFDALMKYGRACLACGRTAPEVKLHVDHIKPRAAGGSNDLGNAQVLSREENLAKGAKHD